MTEELKKFIRPNVTGFLIPAGVFALATVLGFTVAELSIPAIIIGTVLTLAALCLALYDLAMFGKEMKRLQLEGIEQQVASDFGTAVSMAGGQLKLGEKYIFTKGESRVITYDDVRRAYQYVHKTKKGVENRRGIRIELPDGKGAGLCVLRTGKRGQEEAQTIIKHLQSKNPGMKVGYRK